MCLNNVVNSLNWDIQAYRDNCIGCLGFVIYSTTLNVFTPMFQCHRVLTVSYTTHLHDAQLHILHYIHVFNSYSCRRASQKSVACKFMQPYEMNECMIATNTCIAACNKVMSPMLPKYIVYALTNATVFMLCLGMIYIYSCHGSAFINHLVHLSR